MLVEPSVGCCKDRQKYRSWLKQRCHLRRHTYVLSFHHHLTLSATAEVGVRRKPFVAEYSAMGDRRSYPKKSSIIRLTSPQHLTCIELHHPPHAIEGHPLVIISENHLMRPNRYRGHNWFSN